jgi:hypothetical protein
MINRAGTRNGADIEEDANVRMKDRSKCVEEPAMGIDIFLVLLLQTKDYLHGENSFLRAFDPARWGNGYCRGRKTAGKPSGLNTHSE